MKIATMVFLAALASFSSVAAAQQQYQDLSPTLKTVKLFPSLIPVQVVQINFAQYERTNAWLNTYHPPFVATDKSHYQLTDETTSKPLRIDSIKCPTDFTGHPNCDVTYLFLDAVVQDGDDLKLIVNGPNGESEIGKLKSSGLQAFNLSITPQAVPSEKLTTGKTSDVGQVSASITDPYLFRSVHFARTYLSSTDLISTNERDSKSAIAATLGLERNTSASWYIPVHFESSMQGNQATTNLSFLFVGGFQTIFPWKNPTLFYNPVIQASISPVFVFNVQYERRVRQDSTSKTNVPNVNDMEVAPSLSWTNITLLPGLLKRFAPGIELDLQGWYLPFERNGKNSNASLFQGYGDVSLLIPLNPFQRFPIVSFLTSNPSGARVRIKYSDGANAANGFKHSHQVTYGIEIVK